MLQLKKSRFMLREIRNIKQETGEPERRWFSSSDMDLITWHKGYEITGFQLCYDKGRDEHALTWTSAHGFTHRRIEDGEQKGARHKMTPILVPDGTVDLKRIRDQFDEASSEIDPELRGFVLRIIDSMGVIS